MSDNVKNQKEILVKLGIPSLNDMQQEAIRVYQESDHIVLLSPTGSGKTLACLLPIIDSMDRAIIEIQVLILVPSRELAIQIEQVARDMGAGYKINAIYGGRPISKDKEDLQHNPAILIGTPGRVADHVRRGTFETERINVLVLDEFDKSLEVGFEDEMSEIIGALNVKKIILTSATTLGLGQTTEIPQFVGLKNPVHIDYLNGVQPFINIKIIQTPVKDKIESLVRLLRHIGDQPAIVFCNFRDSIERVSHYLRKEGISHGVFHGGLEQIDRERTLVKFRNGTHHLLLATDLAARGIDIPEIKSIIHYHLPTREQEFIHRNGRTARMHRGGTAYILQWDKEAVPDFIKKLDCPNQTVGQLNKALPEMKSTWSTLFISGGRKDKISKGDIAGFFFRQGKLAKDQLGLIELKRDCAFVAVHSSQVIRLIKGLNNNRLKKRKVRVYMI